MKLTPFSLRLGWLGSFLGGLTYLTLSAAIEIYFPDHWAGSPSRLLGFSYAQYSRLLWIPSILLVFGLTGVYSHLSSSIGQLGRVGYLFAATGFGLDIFGNIIEFTLFGLLLVPSLGEFRTGSPGSQFGYQVSGYGTSFLMVGLLIFGIAGLRSTLPFRWRILPFTIGLVYATGLILFFAGLMAVHAFAYGLSWMVLGFFLWYDMAIEKLGSSKTYQES